jgi:hypothetical protein
MKKKASVRTTVSIPDGLMEVVRKRIDSDPEMDLSKYLRSLISKDLASETADIPQRIALAEQLERQAAQLREMKPKPVPYACQITVPLLPSVKRAVMLYGRSFGAKDEDTQIQHGIRWFLETSLTMIAEVCEKELQLIKYRDAEAIEPTDFSERMINSEVDKWLAQMRKKQRARS